jgi:hypothetical protein
MKPERVTTHEHYFATPDYSQADDSTDDVTGRYDAYETATDECGVWSPKTDQHWVTKNFAEARRTARALCDEFRAIHDVANSVHQ